MWSIQRLRERSDDIYSYSGIIHLLINWLWTISALSESTSLHTMHSMCESKYMSPLYMYMYQFSSVALSCLILCDPKDWSTPGFPVHHQLLELTQTHVHQVSDAIQPSYPLLSLSLPAINLSSIRVFSSESVLLITGPKYGSFNISISPSSEYSGLISFRMDWWNLLAVQGTLKSFLQHHSSKASILQLTQLSL